MQKIDGWNEVQASEGSFERMPAGAYVCTILNAEDVVDREYIKVEYDVTEGEWAGEGRSTYERAGFWPLVCYCSYKESAQGLFKSFINAVEASNDGYTWNWDEKSLEGQDVGFVLQNEHYINNNDEARERLIVYKRVPAQEVRDGKHKAPKDKWTDEAAALRDAVEAITGGDTMAKAEADNPFA